MSDFDSVALMLSVLFSSIGLGYFMYGKKVANMVIRYAGLALMIYPYFISNVWAILGVGALLMALPKFIRL